MQHSISLPKQRLIVIAVLTISFIAGLIFYFVTTSQVTTLEKPAIAQNAQNTARENDASSIVSAIGSFVGSNRGKLPQTVRAGASADTLDLCAANCNEGKLDVKLHYYPPGNVMHRSYVADLKVPNADSVYIVNGAQCNAKRDSLEIAQVQVAAAVLYAVAIATGFEQKCASL